MKDKAHGIPQLNIVWHYTQTPRKGTCRQGRLTLRIPFDIPGFDWSSVCAVPPNGFGNRRRAALVNGSEHCLRIHQHAGVIDQSVPEPCCGVDFISTTSAAAMQSSMFRGGRR